jgi:hypothetical protein
MSKTFREWNVEQHWLLPPSVMDFVPADHIAHFIRDMVREQMDLSEILAPYEKEDEGARHLIDVMADFLARQTSPTWPILHRRDLKSRRRGGGYRTAREMRRPDLQ